MLFVDSLLFLLIVWGLKWNWIFCCHASKVLWKWALYFIFVIVYSTLLWFCSLTLLSPRLKYKFSPLISRHFFWCKLWESIDTDCNHLSTSLNMDKFTKRNDIFDRTWGVRSENCEKLKRCAVLFNKFELACQCE